ncbi:MAG: acetoacetate--CoA ligase, partial [Rhodospirillaceae bacterium]|nr:acetoacetate--CoA ligase [Rhodospirillaceae bacterium]
MSEFEPTPLWTPSPDRVAGAEMTRFMGQVIDRYGVSLSGYQDLYQWSVRDMASFWTEIWDFGGVIADARGDRVLVDADKMPGARFFPDARLNFAENLLRRRDDAPAIVFWAEDKVRRAMSFRGLYDMVSRTAQALRALGVKPGDRVAGLLPNMPEAVVAMLATTAIGAVWSSASPDFGVQGVLDRFGQIEPTVLFVSDGYYYNGKTLAIADKVREITAALPTLKATVGVSLVDRMGDLAGLATPLAEFIAPYTAGTIAFERLPFDHPLYIMFSSGTTGVPKCIVHRAGGVLLQHIKEHALHSDVRADDRVFYFTTLGWMMWNWLVSALARGATLLLYDGSPFAPSGNILFDYADAEGMTLFGTSAKFIDALNKGGYRPADTHRLSALRTMTSTGSPLAPESFDYV